MELFDKYMSEVGITAGTEGAQYRIEINTDFTEPGWNVGVMRQNASVDTIAFILPSDTRTAPTYNYPIQ